MSQNGEGKTFKKIRFLAQVLVYKALDGDMLALKEVADRLGGKPTLDVKQG